MSDALTDRFDTEPVRTIQARIPWDDDWQPMACPDKRCGNHGAAIDPVADPRDPTGTENRCPVCLTTVAPIPQRTGPRRQRHRP